LTAIDVGTGFGPLAWRLALLGLGQVIAPMTATAVAAVPHHLAGMAAPATPPDRSAARSARPYRAPR